MSFAKAGLFAKMEGQALIMVRFGRAPPQPWAAAATGPTNAIGKHRSGSPNGIVLPALELGVPHRRIKANPLLAHFQF
jgi:hypothetical protein